MKWLDWGVWLKCRPACRFEVSASILGVLLNTFITGNVWTSNMANIWAQWQCRVIHWHWTTSRLCSGKTMYVLSIFTPLYFPADYPRWLSSGSIFTYVYEYFLKQGFRKTAREMLWGRHFSSVPAPIHAKQELLFEHAISLWIWPSTHDLTCSFWVFFTAQVSGNGSKDGLLYTQVCRSFQSIILA